MPVYQELAKQWYVPLYLFLGFELLHMVITFFTYQQMKKGKASGYYTNYVVLFLDCVAAGFSMGIPVLVESGVSEGLRIGILYALGALLIWFLPNAVYFAKRKKIFYTPEQEDTAMDALEQFFSGQISQLGDQMNVAQKEQAAQNGQEGQKKDMFPLGQLFPPIVQPKQGDKKEEAEALAKEKATPIRSDLYAYCPYCGEAVEKEAKSCNHCNHSLIEE